MRSDDAIEAIRRLKAQYFRYIDTKRWKEWRELFTDDSQFSGLSRTYQGPDEFCSSTAEWLAPAITVHHGHMPEIDVLDETNARGTWAMFDMVQFSSPIEAGAYCGMNGFVGYGYYHETYRRTGAIWQISSLTLERIRIDPTDPGAPFPQLPPGLLGARS